MTGNKRMHSKSWLFSGFSLWLIIGLNLSWSAYGCLGQIGETGYEYVFVDAGQTTPPDQTTTTPDKTVTTPDQTTTTPDQTTTTPDQTTKTPDSSEPPVYYADVYKGFLQEFCTGCHGNGSSQTRVDSYSNETHLAKAGKSSAFDYWTYARDRIKKGEMPSKKPVAEDEQQRLNDGIALFERWAKAGFPEKAGGSTTPNDFKGKEDPFVVFPTTATCKGKDPLPARLWRLTGRQIRYSILDVFGSQLNLPTINISSKRSGGVTNSASESGLDNVDVTQLLKAYEQVSTEILKNNKEWKDCLSKSDDTCVKPLITKYGRLLWRRELTQEESDKLFQGYKSLVKDSRDYALGFIIERLMLSSKFLFRSEMGDVVSGQPNTRRLNHQEVATFLSFTIWQSVPDDELLTAAKENRLGTLPEIRAQIQRMAKDKRALRPIAEFITDWLHIRDILTLQKDTTTFKEITPQLRQDAVDAALKLLEHVIWVKKGSIADVFQSKDVFLNKNLAKLYSSVSSTSDGLEMKQADPTQRMGILTTPAFVMSHSKEATTGFVHRGVFFLEELSCRPLGNPPDDLSSGEERTKNVDKSKLTTRQLLESLHSAEPSCNNCHKKIDPIGAAFEIFDPLGRYRIMENGKPIDASGKLDGFNGMKPEFNNAIELIKNMTDSTHFRQCFTLKLHTYTWGRTPEGIRNCSIATMFEHLKGKNFELLQVHEALLANQQFFLRTETTKK